MKKTYFNRFIDSHLIDWKKSTHRKPLLLRGARQVGKSSSVRHLAETFDDFFEINFEKKDSLAAKQVFERHSNPKLICDELAMLYNKRIDAGKTLLFLDEIQACPDAIAALRFFYEEYPDLHVIAAGSLLEFALAELPSFGVGRIETFFMFPLSFKEFMNATGANLLYEAIQKAKPNSPLPDYLHDKAVEYFKRFLVIGGMPEVVAKYVETQSLFECTKLLSNITATLKSDFLKYRARVPQLRVNAVFDNAVAQMCNRFVYAKVEQDFHLSQIKECVELLVMAGILIPVIHTAANGIPLGAEVNLKKQKYLLLDTGLYQNLSGLNAADIMFAPDFQAVNKGRIAELFAGLELLKSGNPFTQNPLYFWQREAKNSHAEIDYVVQQNEKIIPVEIKAGTKGSMQSLHLFMKAKNSEKGIRCSLENFAHYDKIEVYPLYAISKINESSV